MILISISRISVMSQLYWLVFTISHVDIILQRMALKFSDVELHRLLENREYGKMKVWIVSIILCTGVILNGATMANGMSPSTDESVSKHMVAEAMLTSHFIDAALRAGMSQDEINAILIKVAEQSIISEFWVSDEGGNIEFSNYPDVNFNFPTDSSSKSQALPFAALLDGSESVVVQGLMERELDGKSYKYVGVSGTDKSRIVQIGISESEME